MDAEQTSAFSAEHERLLGEEAIRWVREASEPPARSETDEHIHPVFCIKQKHRWRQIWNMRWANQFMKPMAFKITGVAAAKAMLHANAYMASIDIKDAYLNIPVQRWCRKYQRYIFEGQVWEITTLPFGMAQAPYAFTRFIDPLLRRWRTKHTGLGVIAYLDDLLLTHQISNHLSLAIQDILDDLSFAGLKVNTKVGKSTLIPTQVLTWCGITWDTNSQVLTIPQSRIVAVRDEIRYTLKSLKKGRRPSARMMASLLGKLQSFAEAMLPQKVHCRTILRDLNRAVNRSRAWDSKVNVSQTSVAALIWLRKNLRRMNGASWATPPTPLFTVISDASPYAWGAILKHRDTILKETSGWFSPKESQLWQNEREGAALALAIQAFWPEIATQTGQIHRPGRVLAQLDNAAAVSYVRKQGGRRYGLSVILEKVLERCWDSNIQLMAQWIPGSDMPADIWSREFATQDQGDWELKQSTFSNLCQWLEFNPTIDLMASRLNHKVGKYFSFRPDPLAVDFDALSDEKDWGSEPAYVAPPTSLIPKAIAKARRDRAVVLFVVPLFPTATWYRTFLSAEEGGHRISALVTLPSETSSPASHFIKRKGQDPGRWPGQKAMAAVLSFQSDNMEI